MSFKPAHTTVWVELPVTDLDKGIAFYKAVFDYELTRDDTGPNPVAMISTADAKGVAGHLYPGKPAKGGEGPTVHLAVPDTVEKTMDRLVKAGGTEPGGPVITIPPGRFAYALDPDGNSIGLFEANRED